MHRLRTRHGDRYYCQSTELPRISGYLSPWDFTHFLLELRHGEVGFGELVRIVARTLINRTRALFGAHELHRLTGPGTRRSNGDLGLKAGEWGPVPALVGIREWRYLRLEPSSQTGG